ncbi:hypothetical protein Csa_023616, partial [Cucumis sativus]
YLDPFGYQCNLESSILPSFAGQLVWIFMMMRKRIKILENPNSKFLKHKLISVDLIQTEIPHPSLYCFHLCM